MLTCNYVNKGDLHMNSLHKWMEDNKMSVAQMSEKLDISRAAVHLYIKGKNSPSALTSMKIRKITGLKFSEIIDCSEQEIVAWKQWLERYAEKNKNNL